MELVSIIPGFQPKNDPLLLEKAAASRPVIRTSMVDAASDCRINGNKTTMEALTEQPLRKGDRVVLDFGRHMVGRLTLSLDAAGSHQDAPAFIRIDLAEIPEELEENPEDYNGWLSRSWIQREELHLDVLPVETALPRRYAFRYVRLTVLDTSPKYQLVLRGAACRTESAAEWNRVADRHIPDETLRRIYDVSLRTLAECTQDVLEDGPKRDRRLWLGDLRLQALTSYVSFRSYSVIRRCLYLFAGTRFPDGRMSANVFTEPAPAADDTYLMDFSLMYPIALNDYLARRDDAEAAADLLHPALEQVDYVLSHHVDQSGVLDGEASALGFVDWSDGLNRTAALQGVLICALDAAAALCDRSGDALRRERYAQEAARLRRAAYERLWNEGEGYFVSGGQVSIHSQVWMTLAGVMPDGRAESAFEKAQRLPGAPRMTTPYMHHYYVMALLHAGLKAQAEAHVKDYWGGMLNAGADTFWECWDPDHPQASPYGGRIVNSYCHAWSCTPAYIIDQYFS